MKLGLQVPSFTFSADQGQLGDTFATIAERAERAGFYSLWVMDHFFQIPNVGPVTDEMLEGWSTLAFAAGRTNHIKLGTMVTGVTYRYPALLVKTATTLDVLSHGRAYLGIGAAWNEEEHRGLGVPFPPLAERFERLEETLQIAHQMWNGDEQPYNGKHYQLERPLNSPQVVQKPHPPILIGGTGERKTLRFVAQYGDACNIFMFPDLAQVEHKFDVLRDHCQSIGRPYEQIEKTTLGHLHLTRDGRNNSMTPDALIGVLRNLAAIGVDQAIFGLHNVADLEPFDLLATQVVPAAEQIEVAGR
ncbi:MAG TPA: LLM class F420-dependent oxidoreductase [Ktedonobacteraceae bacterium]|jgi:F420-dependent oxidoreductase-like protein|nr:LLM class F420-dependent oxidoreductase [Ktedonobacteraceae bacterium]